MTEAVALLRPADEIENVDEWLKGYEECLAYLEAPANSDAEASNRRF